MTEATKLERLNRRKEKQEEKKRNHNEKHDDTENVKHDNTEKRNTTSQQPSLIKPSVTIGAKTSASETKRIILYANDIWVC